MKKNKKTARKGKAFANEKEYAVIRFLKKKSEATLEEMAEKIFKKSAKKYEKAHSWARNSVRWPFKMKYIKHTDRGTYAITPAGKKYKHA